MHLVNKGCLKCLTVLTVYNDDNDDDEDKHDFEQVELKFDKFMIYFVRKKKNTLRSHTSNPFYKA